MAVSVRAPVPLMGGLSRQPMILRANIELIDQSRCTVSAQWSVPSESSGSATALPVRRMTSWRDCDYPAATRAL